MSEHPSWKILVTWQLGKKGLADAAQGQQVNLMERSLGASKGGDRKEHGGQFEI